MDRGTYWDAHPRRGHDDIGDAGSHGTASAMLLLLNGGGALASFTLPAPAAGRWDGAARHRPRRHRRGPSSQVHLARIPSCSSGSDRQAIACDSSPWLPGATAPSSPTRPPLPPTGRARTKDGRQCENVERLGERMDGCRRRSTPKGSTRCWSCCRGGIGGEGQHDPAGVRRRSIRRDASLTAFKVPTPLELAHDFLWRVHQAVPPKGTIGVFNRSHYEDVLVVRVHQPRARGGLAAALRSDQPVRAILIENGVTDPQVLPAHLAGRAARSGCWRGSMIPTKYWKFNPSAIWGSATRWDAYTTAYQEVLSRTSTTEAPWYVVPADKKYLRDLLVAQVVDGRAGADGPGVSRTAGGSRGVQAGAGAGLSSCRRGRRSRR